MANSLTQVCSIVDSLAALELDVLRRINKKFAALQNLAALLEQLTNLSSWIPSLTGLIPVTEIDVGMYNELAARCPYLKLPPATNQLTNLQAAVVAAYTALLQKIMRSPDFRLGELQDEMTKYQAQMNNMFGQASQFLACLQTVCAAGESAINTLTAMSDKDISKEITTFATNYVAKAGNVLSDKAQQKYDDAKAAASQLKALGADSMDDYTTAKAAITK
jgi:hypothetical protein